MHSEINGASLPPVMALAYLGDARHSLHVRRALIGRGISKPKELNAAALEFVTAAAQAKAFATIEPLLLGDERDVARRAANSTHLNKPRHASGAEYRAATAFEAVVGMLEWIGDRERLEFLLCEAHKEDMTRDKEN